MRNLLLPEIDCYRLKSDFVMMQLGSYGNEYAGMFVIKNKHKTSRLQIIASDDGDTWEHVSVSVVGEKRCPTWEEMCQVKGLFWEPEDTVVQFHPRASEYVSHHPYCLHLWKRVGSEYILPPSILVGPKS